MLRDFGGRVLFGIEVLAGKADEGVEAEGEGDRDGGDEAEFTTKGGVEVVACLVEEGIEDGSGEEGGFVGNFARCHADEGGAVEEDGVDLAMEGKAGVVVVKGQCGEKEE